MAESRISEILDEMPVQPRMTVGTVEYLLSGVTLAMATGDIAEARRQEAYLYRLLVASIATGNCRTPVACAVAALRADEIMGDHHPPETPLKEATVDEIGHA